MTIARALANNPRLPLADEPTGQLDLETARQIMRLIRSVAHGEGITAIVATHDNALIELADRVLELKDGREPAGRHAGLSTRKPAVRAAVDSSAS